MLQPKICNFKNVVNSHVFQTHFYVPVVWLVLRCTLKLFGGSCGSRSSCLAAPADYVKAVWLLLRLTFQLFGGCSGEMFELVESRQYAYVDDSTLLAVVHKPADRPAIAASPPSCQVPAGTWLGFRSGAITRALCWILTKLRL